MAPASALRSLESVSVASSRHQVLTTRGARTMTEFSHKNAADSRKAALYASLSGWCYREKKSRDEFADELSEISGRNVTRAILENWLRRDSDFREMPPSLDGFWAELTGDTAHFSRRLPQSERESAMRAIDQMEAQA